MNEAEPNRGLIREPQVLAILGVGPTTLHALRRRGEFPQPVRIPGCRASLWPRVEVEAYVASLIAERDAARAEAQAVAP